MSTVAITECEANTLIKLVNMRRGFVTFHKFFAEIGLGEQYTKNAPSSSGGGDVDRCSFIGYEIHIENSFC